MIFAAPFALLGLLALPGILLLLRLNPPPARRVAFPPLALLRGLGAARQTPRRIPLWLLVLRLAATALVCLGLAQPSLHKPPALPGTGPVLLVIDNGFAAAPFWPSRRAAAQIAVAAAAQANRGIAILATARSAAGAAPRILGVMPAAAAAQIIDALQPVPWPADRAAAAAALAGAPETTRLYIADGITDGPGFTDFMKTLAPSRVFAAAALPPLLAAPYLAADGSLRVHVFNPPPGARLQARAADGAILASAAISAGGDAAITLPPALANKLTSLALDGPPSAGGTVLLDGSSRISLVGLAAGSPSADTPYLGPLYFIRRALPLGARQQTGGLAQLTTGKADIIILADAALDPAQQSLAETFIAAGGVLIRFAGPLTAAAPDPLSPDPLLPGDRRLGGALTWASPQTIAPFPANTPFAGLAVDPAVTISRQSLADPTQLASGTVWASLTDGTPLVIGKRIGKGYLVAFLTTANTDWSSLALSGLLPAMLDRLASLAHGIAPQPGGVLPLRAALTAFGGLVPAAGSAGLAPGGLPGLAVSPT